MPLKTLQDKLTEARKLANQQPGSKMAQLVAEISELVDQLALQSSDLPQADESAEGMPLKEALAVVGAWLERRKEDAKEAQHAHQWALLMLFGIGTDDEIDSHLDEGSRLARRVTTAVQAQAALRQAKKLFLPDKEAPHA